ncbi:MAG: hypothetical protein FJX74_16965 [Armatimonadetes bacterium]|nr:hypothetical protein [Armatimonadota bacterium]
MFPPTVVWLLTAALTCLSAAAIPQSVDSSAQRGALRMDLDTIARQFRVAYRVPETASGEVVVRCSWAPAGSDEWRPARVRPWVSQTALELLDEAEWRRWVLEGRIVELRAAGLERFVVFDPYPEAQIDGRVDVDFRVRVETPDGIELSSEQTRLQADNSDVVYLEDWSRVLQRDALADAPVPEDRKWQFRTDLAPEEASLGNGLRGQSPADLPLPKLTYPLDLTGWYAIFVCTPARWGVEMRLTGDERADLLGSDFPRQEFLWRWAPLDRQHLVIGQGQSYTGYAGAAIDYVKLVPLTEAQVAELEAPLAGKRDKVIAGYWEPYSWAFGRRVTETLQHREPLAAFAEARMDIVDTQVGRFGDTVVYESRHTDQLLYSTIGDPIGPIAQPKTDNVGLMQQHTNTLDATLRYARELGLTCHANWGATCCYPGTPLESGFSKAHPEWRRGSALRYEVPEVREYMLRLWRETLEIGAPGLSIDFCRYPEGIDTAETCTGFLRDLRQLADEFEPERGAHIPILIRFPARGVRLNEVFDYRTWVKEGLVDYLCPSNIQARHLHFDIAEYRKATRGTRCKLLPVVDGLGWALDFPGPFLRRVEELYQAGADGIYVYQADGRILTKPMYRRMLALLGSRAAVARWWAAEDRLNGEWSKGLYLSRPNEYPGWHGWERLRVWTEGLEPGPLELYLDGALVNRCEGPPYLLGTEEYASDGVIPPGEHELRVRAQDGEGWLERTFKIVGAG